MSDADRWWATGVADGEACFYANLHRTSKKGGHAAPFTLHVSLTVQLRADDVEMLEQFKCVIGLTSPIRRKMPTWTKSKPVVRIDATRVSELAKVVDHFDRFPLRSKKASEYPAWRELALMKIASPAGSKESPFRSNPDRVRELVASIRSSRIYKEVAIHAS